jgi:putative FmdB family regulatory protein
MPLNEYKCCVCGYVFDYHDTTWKEVRMHRECPECKQDAKKQMSSSSFKVNGFSEANGYAGNGK